MAMLQGKKILITGLLSNRSIAWGIAKAAHREGATLAFTYQAQELKDRVADLAKEFGSPPVLPCDVANDEQVDTVFATLRAEWGSLDGLVHSIAFAPREALKGGLLDGLDRKSTRLNSSHIPLSRMPSSA